MSIITAYAIIIGMSFQNDFERLRIIQLVLSFVDGAGIKQLHYFFHLNKCNQYGN